MSSRKRLMIVLLALLIVSTGCSGRLTNMSQSDDFNIDEMLKSPWAIAGVVLNPNLNPDRVAQMEIESFQDQWQGASQVYAPMLYGGFVQRVPQMELWTFDSIFNQVPQEDLEALLKNYSRSYVLGLDDFKSIGQALPRLRYLVLARVDKTEIETEQDAASKESDQRMKDGRDPHGGGLNRSLVVRRRVWMTMQVYDLTDGRLQWSGTVERWKDEQFTSAEIDRAADIKVQSSAKDGATPEVTIEGTPLRTPSLADVIDDVCSNLVRELIPD